MAGKSSRKSTNGRVPFTGWARRAAVVVAGTVAPGGTARWAERVWFTLPERPSTPGTSRPGADGGAGAGAASGSPRGAQVVAPAGEPFDASLGGRRIRGWVWGDGPVVYLVHGWGGSAEQLAPLVPSLLDQGLRVVVFDGLSHGRSDAGVHGPRSSDAVELGQCLDAVAARFGPARAVVAHSLGALAALLALRDVWLYTERLVLIAPIDGVPAFLVRFRTTLGFGRRVERRLVALSERRTGYAVAELDVARLGAELETRTDVDAPLRPHLLVIHDLEDRETGHAGSAALVRSWPGAQLHTTVGLGHRRILRDPAVSAAVARFIAGLPVEPTLHGDDRPTPLALGVVPQRTRVA